MTCSIADCGRPAIARTWCAAHYARWRAYGEPGRLAVRKQVSAVGESKACTTCNKSQDLSEFPYGYSPCRDCRRDLNYSQRRTCSDCSTKISNGASTGLCRQCIGARRRNSATRKRLTGRADGYVVLTGYYDHPNSRTRGHILEHVKVMADMLGRALVAGENAHHINGVRDDNRPENLELWSHSQPKGQRVPDKVAWAKELLALYEPDALSASRHQRIPDIRQLLAMR